jgi:hypothetical protein
MSFLASAGLNVFAGGHRGCCAQQRDEFVIPFNFDAQDAEAVIRIVKGDALNQTRQRLPRTCIIRSAISAKHYLTNLALCASASLTPVTHFGEMGG